MLYLTGFSLRCSYWLRPKRNLSVSSNESVREAGQCGRGGTSAVYKQTGAGSSRREKLQDALLVRGVRDEGEEEKRETGEQRTVHSPLYSWTIRIFNHSPRGAHR